MSLDATRFAWKQDIRPSHKLVLLALADRAGEYHDCYPSIKRIEMDTGLHRETIMEAIEQLGKLGILAISRTSGKSNKYTIVGVEGRHGAEQYGKADRLDQTGKAVRKSSPGNRTAPVRKTGHDQYGKPDPNLPIESTKNHNTYPRFAARAYLEQKGVDVQTITDWLAIRKDKKKTPTKAAIDLLENEAIKSGKTLVEVIQICCQEGWAGYKASWQTSARNGSGQWDGDLSIFKD